MVYYNNIKPKREGEKEGKRKEGAKSPFYSGTLPGCCKVTVGVEFRQNANRQEGLIGHNTVANYHPGRKPEWNVCAELCDLAESSI